jgi:beta-xylosidase
MMSLQKRRWVVVVLLWVLVGASAGMAEVREYANPLDVMLADPHVVKHEDTYYLYATSTGTGFYVWWSQDLVHWRKHGLALQRTEESWGRHHYWAPEVIEHEGAFYMVYSARGETETLRVCLARSDSPLGPFEDIAAPWVDIGRANIDGHIFTDDDGSAYLYYTIDVSESPQGEIHVVPLGPDLVSFAGEAVLCIAPSQPWEGPRWNEAPFVFRHEDTYILMYSGQGFYSASYAVGFATADSPLGPWTKYEGNPILQQAEGISGPGHNSVVESPDGSELFIVYHKHQSPAGGGARQLAIDRLEIIEEENGRVRVGVEGPSLTPRAFPSGAAPFPRGRSDRFDDGELDRGRWTIFRENPEMWSIEESRLVIRTQDGDVHQRRSDLRNLFLQYAPEGDYTVTTKVSFSPQANYEQAFLMIWQDHNNFIRLSTAHIDSLQFDAAVEIAGEYSGTSVENPIGEEVYLRIVKRGQQYRCYASADGRRWGPVGGVLEARFTLPKIGIGAASPASGEVREARFEFLEIE